MAFVDAICFVDQLPMAIMNNMGFFIIFVLCAATGLVISSWSIINVGIQARVRGVNLCLLLYYLLLLITDLGALPLSQLLLREY